MAAVFSASKAKSETSSPNVMRDVFEQPIINAVATGDLVYTLRPTAKVNTPITRTTTNEYGYVNTETTVETQKYPLQVHGENSGFATLKYHF